MQQLAAAGAGVPSRDGEQSQAQPLGFPPAGFVPGQGEGLRPGEQVGGERDEGTPDLVLHRQLCVSLSGSAKGW